MAEWDTFVDTPAAVSEWDDGAGQIGSPTGNNDNKGETNGENAHSNACRNCGQEGHFSRECPEPKKMTGECFRCGQVGHNKAECTNDPIERPFTGTCRFCNEEGHRAADCPQKPAEKCRACGVEGHKATDCNANRKIDRSNVDDMEKEAAWRLVKEGANDKDMTTVKKAIDSFVKADDSVTYPDLERRFRAENIPVFCIAQEMELPKTFSSVNLQGKPGCKFVVGYFFSAKPRRKILEDMWPDTPEENIERLSDAGVQMENYVPLCRNCNELGHVSKECTQEKPEKVPVVITCPNCGEDGHRLRDCKQERKARGNKTMECRRCGEAGHMAKECPNAESGGGGGRACRNCGSEEHLAKDCDQPRKDVECRNCGELGHMSKECDKPKNPANMTCRNCDQVGHMSRDCPEPKDWSRVQCSNCGEKGHGAKRCPQAPANNGSTDAVFATPDASKTGSDFTPSAEVGGWGATEASNDIAW